MEKGVSCFVCLSKNCWLVYYVIVGRDETWCEKSGGRGADLNSSNRKEGRDGCIRKQASINWALLDCCWGSSWLSGRGPMLPWYIIMSGMSSKGLGETQAVSRVLSGQISASLHKCVIHPSTTGTYLGIHNGSPWSLAVCRASGSFTAALPSSLRPRRFAVHTLLLWLCGWSDPWTIHHLKHLAIMKVLLFVIPPCLRVWSPATLVQLKIDF